LHVVRGRAGDAYHYSLGAEIWESHMDGN
jgi:hypothetical protein